MKGRGLSRGYLLCLVAGAITGLVVTTAFAAVIYGSPQNDCWLYGTLQNDTIHAGAGDDCVDGRDGRDELNLGNDGDIATGRADVDVINGFDGNDFRIAQNGVVLGMDGDSGADHITGGYGADFIIGGSGADPQLSGQEHDDLIDAAAVDLNDVIYAGPGYDECHVDGGVLVSDPPPVWDTYSGCETLVIHPH